MKGADVWVVQARDSARLAFESFAVLGVVGQVRGKDLDGDEAIQARVAGLVHLPHTARAEWLEDLMRPERSARLDHGRNDATFRT
jgi:hypothetical protein